LTEAVFSDNKDDPKTKEGKIYSLISQDYKDIYQNSIEDIKDEKNKAYYKLLLITDFVSGMTDGYALDLYKKLTVY
jgi:dGTPase